MPVTAHWEHFPHQADVGVRGLGETLEQAFEQAALALTAVVTDPATVVPREMLEISCNAPDAELLLVEWLNSLIFEMDTRCMLFARFEVHLHENCLNAKAWGETLDLVRHRPAVEIKGATYTALEIAQQADGSWMAQCILDV
jgi:SHS2 domain-containing protein